MLHILILPYPSIPVHKHTQAIYIYRTNILHIDYWCTTCILPISYTHHTYIYILLYTDCISTYHPRPSTTPPNPTTGYRGRVLTRFQPQPILTIWRYTHWCVTPHTEATSYQNIPKKRGVAGRERRSIYIYTYFNNVQNHAKTVPRQNLSISSLLCKPTVPRRETMPFAVLPVQVTPTDGISDGLSGGYPIPWPSMDPPKWIKII